MPFPHLYRDPDGDCYVAHQIGDYRPWHERFRPWSLAHRLVWLAQAGRVPTRTHQEALAFVRRRRALRGAPR